MVIFLCITSERGENYLYDEKNNTHKRRKVASRLQLDRFMQTQNIICGQISHNTDDLSIVNLVHLEILCLWEKNLTAALPAQLGRLVNLTSVTLYSS